MLKENRSNQKANHELDSWLEISKYLLKRGCISFNY